MSKDTNNLPYFNSLSDKRQKLKEKENASFLMRKFRPTIKKKFHHHYLVQPIHFKALKFIKENSKNYPYFLRFDIRLFYPSINHQVLLKKLPETYQKLTKKTVSRRFKKKLKKDIPEFLSQSPYQKGLSVGSPLSYALSGIFLLDLDNDIPIPFLRQTDDYLIFCKYKKESEKILREVISPKLRELDLEINEKKTVSGKFHSEKVDFIGFQFYSGYFSIKEKKKEKFKKKIVKITYLTKKKPEKAVIKQLNNQILGFGHYYKFSNCKQVFEKLDGFCRMRLRRWLLNQKKLLSKESNLILTNEVIKNMGLKSLNEIKQRFDAKNKRKNKKPSKKRVETGQHKSGINKDFLEKRAHYYEQKLMLEELKKLTGLVGKLEKRIAKIERKLDGRDSPR